MSTKIVARLVAGLITLAILAGAALAIPASAAAQGPGTVFSQDPPPRPMIDVKPDRPSPDHVWQPGYYDLRGSAWVWVSGSWALPPAGKKTWVPAVWAHADAGWYLVPGYWR
ncbi:MAG TPA: hypothetical protein VMT93_05080 [Gemmatimonadaceae bacterium]|nr:hypothetical protein [Gemmatimonadaceae bacterium]